MIDAKTTIEEVLGQYPETVKIFMDFGIPCLVCGEPLWGTIEEVAEKHRIDVKRLLDALNSLKQG